ncbi:MAG: hypothetical protein ACFFBD_06235 [Candidatus Hodarchaeota archaeon]
MVNKRLKHLLQDGFVLIVILNCSFPNSIAPGYNLWSRIYSNEIDLNYELGKSETNYLPFGRPNESMISTKTQIQQSDSAIPFIFFL